MFHSAKEVADRLCSLELPTQPIVSWIKDVCDDGVSFFNEIPDTKDDLNKDFNSLSLLIAIRHNIEQRFGGSQDSERIFGCHADEETDVGDGSKS